MNSKTGSTKYSNNLSDSMKNPINKSERVLNSVKNKNLDVKDDIEKLLIESDNLFGDNSDVSYNSFLN